ncbi:tetratricopeptide repeat protein [Ruficoccus amylovorans]|uniref:Tetratricopeptide repeat protein n=1 Tax=Ruficoccus amylovorans TaxID=1804625 RepID=A0A842HEP4_9BACT|nr:tetratricopeptide repeat protein [Ruficoccus amylovorans]MBC2594993.1 tetratricopeptide repeat protein [Ruficoccus amylovorans]
MRDVTTGFLVFLLLGVLAARTEAVSEASGESFPEPMPAASASVQTTPDRPYVDPPDLKEWGSLEGLAHKLREQLEQEELSSAPVEPTVGPSGSTGQTAGQEPSYFQLQLQQADAHRKAGNTQAAIKRYTWVLERAQGDELLEKGALLGMAQTYFSAKEPERCVSILKNYLRAYPKDENRPELLFRLALLYREIGLHENAITTYYQVLSAIVSEGETDFERYLDLARLVMFEIACSHFQLRNYEVALQHFERIDIIRMHPQDRETIAFYSFVCQVRLARHQEALETASAFARDYPQSPLLPEIMYARGQLLFKLERPDEAVVALVDLLETAERQNDEETAGWLPWKQQAGNLIANYLFHKGDYAAALSAYQGLASLNPDLFWQLPVIYQIGICFERLHLYDRARESYAYIIAATEDMSAQQADALHSLTAGAHWRYKLLNWVDRTDTRYRSWVGTPTARQDELTPKRIEQ